MQGNDLRYSLPTSHEFLDFRQRAEQLSLAHDTLGIVSWVWDIASNRVQWFGDVSPLLGLPPRTFAGDFSQFVSLLHPEDAQRARQSFVDCLKGRRIQYRSEERVRTPEGGLRWIEFNCRGTYGSAGRAIRMSGVLADITYRKVQEEALAMSEEKFFKAYHATPDGIALTREADGMIVEINAAYSRITGHSASDALGKTTVALGLWPSEQERNAAVRELRASGRTRDLVLDIVTRAGAKRTVIMNAERILIGEVPHIMSVTRDITEQRMAEQALAKSERLYRSLFDSALDGIVILSPQGTIVDVNAAACRASGFTREELVGNSANSFVDPDDPAGPLPVAELIERGSLLAEHRVMRKGRASLPVEAHAWRLPDGNMQLIMRDLTDRKRSEAMVHDLNVSLERRVVERTAELEAANRELEAFSQMISHDLRAPVRAITGFADALRKQHSAGLDAKGERYLELVEKNATRMNTMIGELLKFAQAGRAAVDKIPVDMQSLVAGVVDELNAAVAAGAEVEIGVLPQITGAPSLLRQVWINLLSNAFKFSSKVARARIEIGAERGERHVEFFVRDNGCGFDEEYADKLFGMFQRLHSEREFEGTGVGLAIVQRIIERHGGRISARSAPGEGATFRFSLPD